MSITWGLANMASLALRRPGSPFALRKAEKDEEKELREAQKRKKQGLGPSKASILGLEEEKSPEENFDAEPEKEEKEEKKTKMSHKDMKDTLASFKDRPFDGIGVSCENSSGFIFSGPMSSSLLCHVYKEGEAMCPTTLNKR